MWAHLLVTKLEYGTNTLNLELCQKNPACHMEFIQKACSRLNPGVRNILSSLPCSSSVVLGLNLNDSKVKESPEKTPVSDHSFVLPWTDSEAQGWSYGSAAAKCQAVNYSQSTQQLTFINALLDTPKRFQCTDISVAISALPRQMLGA